MIIYPTKQTIERFNIPMFEELDDLGKAISAQVISKEQNDPLIQWGCKLFYFDRRKCLQVVNFASKFTLILIDVKVKDIADIPNFMAMYMFDIYKNDLVTTKLLKRFFQEYPFVAYSALKDKSIITTLNHTQRVYLEDGYRLYEFIENNVMQSKKLNYKINFDWIFTSKVDGETDYFVSGEKFAELLKKRYEQ